MASYRSLIAGPRDEQWWYGSLRRTRRFPEGVADWLDHSSRIFLLGFSILYFLGTGVIASHRFLWADEVLTAYMKRIPVPQLWDALKTGVDIEPPLFHLITRAFTDIFGATPLALRMPAIVGGWLMCVSLYLFVSRRSRPLYGAIAMLIPFATGAAEYTYEARSYGIALGLSGLAMVCWQGAAERRRRNLCLVGLTFCLAAAMACHYYMLLVWFSIGLGEMVRSLSRARVDRAVWIALAASVIPLPFHIPLIRAAMTFHGGNWSAATASGLWAAHRIFLTRAGVLGAAIVTALALCESFGFTRHEATRKTRPGAFPLWEIVVALALGLSLVGAFFLARLSNGIFTLRYGICLVFGASLLPLPVLWRYDSVRPLAGVLSLVALAGFFLAHQVLRHQNHYQTPVLLQSAGESSPIAIDDTLDFLELIYNAPPQIAARLYYLTSRENSIRYTGTDDDERGLLLLRQWFPIQTEAVNEFLRQHRRILIWRGSRQRRWLLPVLLEHGATVRLAKSLKTETLFMATVPAGAF